MASKHTNGNRSSPEKQEGSKCEKREIRITKENLYMVLALWMEESPYSQSPPKLGSKKFNKVGVVFVLPNDRVLAADCSRDDVHGVARVMINHCGMLEGRLQSLHFSKTVFTMCQTSRTVESFPRALPSNRTRVDRPKGLG